MRGRPFQHVNAPLVGKPAKARSIDNRSLAGGKLHPWSWPATRHKQPANDIGLLRYDVDGLDGGNVGAPVAVEVSDNCDGRTWGIVPMHAVDAAGAG